MDFAQLEQALDKLMSACAVNDERQIYGLLVELVPEHQSCLSIEAGSGGSHGGVVVPLKNPGRPS